MLLNIFCKNKFFYLRLYVSVIMNLQNISVMDEKLTSNNIEDEVYIKKNDDDYKNLIIKLKEIRSIISSLEKKNT